MWSIDEALEILEDTIEAIREDPHPDQMVNQIAISCLKHAHEAIMMRRHTRLTPDELEEDLKHGRCHFRLTPDERGNEKVEERIRNVACISYAFYAALPPGVKLNLPPFDWIDDWIDYWTKVR